MKPIPSWVHLTFGIAVTANVLAAMTTRFTVEEMNTLSAFAREVRRYDLLVIRCYETIAYPLAVVGMFAYLAPIVRFFRAGCPQPAPLVVQRRVISAPLVVAGTGFLAWVVGVGLLPMATIHRFGQWTLELMSQHVLSPTVNGFLGASTTYLLLDAVYRRLVVPYVFPAGGLADVPGAISIGVRGRLLVFLIAVGLVPSFTLLGLLRAAAVRLETGLPVEAVIPTLARVSLITFVVFVVLGFVLAAVLGYTFTRPLTEMAQTLRRVQGGDLSGGVAVTSSDEVGRLEDGVNALVLALRDKERIVQTFGRVVEPWVRDRLLAGDLQPEGEVRTASVLFCDLRGFTGLAEHAAPGELVTTLNAFFTAMTPWVRECGGFVDKFIGDAMLVVFGLFEGDGELADRDGAAAAIRCAQGMHARLEQLNLMREAAGVAPLGLKVAAHTGPVIAGTVGAADRHEYTVIGDTVNVAARLQEVCREHGHGVLVSEATYHAARAVMDPGAVRPIEAVSLRGRAEPIRVFVLGNAADAA